MSTPAERLALVREAIAAVLQGGQSFRIGDRQVTQADYGQLLREERALVAEVAAVTRGARGRITRVIPL